MQTQFYSLVLGILAVWRLTHLLNAEDGPFDLLVRLRRFAGTGFWASLLDCFYCLSLWIAAPAALFLSRRPLEWLFSWLALSGGACLLERMVRDPVVIQPMLSSAEGDVDNVLRSETFAASERHAGEQGNAYPTIHVR